MTTQIVMVDEVTRVRTARRRPRAPQLTRAQFLKKLGVQTTTKPSECTHLVARSLVRTEKFLCAIARAPYILSEKWLVASYAAKQLLRAPPPPPLSTPEHALTH